ncbi:MAG: PIG-L family deacetylase [Dehalococcoidia bacterium]|jgi:LmbE family N-acetylglucosaminyl deacetylase|nr:PIG-L family deacetylase [Dehalococcoidia bacterium]MDW8009020.1 PIG-L deacetylase family protein [Chloroflexota bacterium]
MAGSDEQVPKRALVVAAHPDDAEFGCAGTAALWSRDGWEFYYLVCTDGSKGSNDPETLTDRLIATRRQEQREAARLLGVKEVFFLDYVDGEVTYSRELVRDIVRYIRLIRPDAVFTHEPGQIIANRAINHPDHRAVGEATLDAVYPMARTRPAYPELVAEGLEPHRVSDVYLWSSGDPNFSVDITDVLELKVQALLCHRSQIREPERLLENLRQRLRGEDGRYHERFRHIQLAF